VRSRSKKAAGVDIAKDRRPPENRGEPVQGGTDRLLTSVWCDRLDGGTSGAGHAVRSEGFGGTTRSGDVLLMMPGPSASVQQFSQMPTIR